MSDEPAASAAMCYKELTEIATNAATRLRRLDAEKCDRLRDEVSAGQERLDEAKREQELVVEGVRKRWDSAMEELWNERWMRVTPMPEGDPAAPPASSREAIALVQAAYLELREALGKPRSWLSQSRRPREDPWES
jgi:hypothetical protein